MKLKEFIQAQKEDSVTFWRLSSKQHQNLLNEAIEYIKKLEEGHIKLQKEKIDRIGKIK